MSQFLTELFVKEIGEGRWEILASLDYESDLLQKVISVPVGFRTDFASVPRVPIAYWFYGDRAHRESTIHDWLYRVGTYTRRVVDAVFLEAMESRGKLFFVRWPMWAGVRLGGWVAWKKHRRKT